MYQQEFHLKKIDLYKSCYFTLNNFRTKALITSCLILLPASSHSLAEVRQMLHSYVSQCQLSRHPKYGCRPKAVVQITDMTLKLSCYCTFSITSGNFCNMFSIGFIVVTSLQSIFCDPVEMMKRQGLSISYIIGEIHSAMDWIYSLTVWQPKILYVFLIFLHRSR